jgi:hypothetical protein
VPDILTDIFSKWVAKLHQLPTCSAFYHSFLELIEENLLVPDQQKRLSIDKVCREFDEMRKLSRDSAKGESYLTKGIPWIDDRPHRPMAKEISGKLKVCRTLSTCTGVFWTALKIIQMQPSEASQPKPTPIAPPASETEQTQNTVSEDDEALANPQLIVTAPTEDVSSSSAEREAPSAPAAKNTTRNAEAQAAIQSRSRSIDLHIETETTLPLPTQTVEHAAQQTHVANSASLVPEQASVLRHRHLEHRSTQRNSTCSQEVEHGTSISDATPKRSADETHAVHIAEARSEPRKNSPWRRWLRTFVLAPVRLISCFHA